jgi:protein ImuB
VRICAVSLPELRVEVARASSDPELASPRPLGIVVAPAPLTESKLLGNMRLDVVSHEARALGVRAGQTLAQARARAGNLIVRVVRPDAVRTVLARLAEVALAFGATVAFDAGGGFGDVVWVDVTGCAHLHAHAQAEGEAILAARLAGAFGSLGHACAVAIADGPRAAAILAAAFAAAASFDPRGFADVPPVVVVPPGKNAEALAPLPVSALPIAAEDVRWLAKVGVRTVTELRQLPRAALATRLGAQAHAVLALADGDDRAPLTPYVPPEIPEERAELEYGVEGSDALVFVAKSLADRVGARLAGRAVAAARLELDLVLDQAMLPAGAERVDRIAIALPAPLSSPQDLLAALRPKIERHVLRAPVLEAKLRAPELVHKREAALTLLEPQPRADRALPRLLAELAADLGEEAVGKLVVGDAWSPDDRSRFVRTGAKAASTKKPRHVLSSVPEPTRVLAQPIAVAREDVRIVRHLTRLESVAWWRLLPGEVAPRGVDYVYAWADDGAAWVEIDRATGATRIRGWFD